MEEQQEQPSTEEVEKVNPEEVKLFNKINKQLKGINIAIKIVIAVCAIAFIGLLTGIMVDNKTPKIVYLIAMLIPCAVWSLSFWLLKKRVKSLQRQAEKFLNLPEDALLGGKKTDKEALKPKADPQKVKDKVYYILTGIALFGDALAIVGVALLASKANVHAAVTVIFILAGAVILTVFHIAATVRFFRRKSAAEQKTIPLTDLHKK